MVVVFIVQRWVSDDIRLSLNGILFERG
jgi:hypothetical protein